MFCLRLDSLRDVTLALYLLLGGTASPAFMSVPQPCSLTALVTKTAHSHLFLIYRIKHKPQVWKREESLARENTQWSKLKLFADDTLLYLIWLSIIITFRILFGGVLECIDSKAIRPGWVQSQSPMRLIEGLKQLLLIHFLFSILRWCFVKLSQMLCTAICTLRVSVSIPKSKSCLPQSVWQDCEQHNDSLCCVKENCFEHSTFYTQHSTDSYILGTKEKYTSSKAELQKVIKN